MIVNLATADRVEATKVQFSTSFLYCAMLYEGFAFGSNFLKVMVVFLRCRTIPSRVYLSRNSRICSFGSMDGAQSGYNRGFQLLQRSF